MVHLRGASLTLERYPTILGVKFDPHFSFAHHAKAIATKARTKLALLKATAGSTWGASKETLLVTFKGLIKSVINYAAPVWAPNASPSSFHKLQKVQNAALRVVTGCHVASPISHLHHEVWELPVEPHAHMLGAQFLATALQPNHCSFPLLTSNPEMKHTLYTKYHHIVSPYLKDGSLPPTDLKSTLKSIHSNAVLKVIDDLGPNPLTGTQGTIKCPSTQALLVGSKPIL